MSSLVYHKAIELLHRVSSPQGFEASANDVSNYKRVWARDGVICGLAALASNDEELIATFQKTLQTLADHQHEIGTIPSNVNFTEKGVEVSYGGLAGRVDAVSWFIIGVCQLAHYKDDSEIVKFYSKRIEKAIHLLECWEFNNNHLMYVPISGNWADEYITDGYVLYDQLLRIWALKSYNHFIQSEKIAFKIWAITEKIVHNFLPNSKVEKVHPKAYHEAEIKEFMPCSFSPSGYKMYFDAFAHSLAFLLSIGDTDFQKTVINYTKKIKGNLPLKLVPAFWPPIHPTDWVWNILKSNCKYEFRNQPYEFHNGGSWPMVNGFLA
ncbi:glucosidase family protein [Flavobacterium piscinae]|uniref:fructofuranosidase/invertase n=1 Tax=Flavobacterium piscinae TaxID=2506424 RepID=UPI002AAA9CBE|nr:fructofuranosidase/invertase [Flavobacterium piscinae]